MVLVYKNKLLHASWMCNKMILSFTCRELTWINSRVSALLVEDFVYISNFHSDEVASQEYLSVKIHWKSALRWLFNAMPGTEKNRSHMFEVGQINREYIYECLLLVNFLFFDTRSPRERDTLAGIGTSPRNSSVCDEH